MTSPVPSEVRNLRLRTGITVPCLIHGDPAARPVLLLHAWGESRRSFDRLVPRLAGFRIYAPDLRGQGDADKPEEGYSLAAQAEDAAAVLDGVQQQCSLVLGSSSGGYVAQQLALAHPERVAGLVLAGSPRDLRGRPAFADEVDGLTDPVSKDWVRASLSWFSPAPAVPAWYIEDRVSDGAKMPALAWKLLLNGLCTAVPPTEAGTIRTPTLVLWGGRDRVLPRSEQEALVARLPHSVLKVYPEAGHLLLWERPDRIGQDAASFWLSLG